MSEELGRDMGLLNRVKKLEKTTEDIMAGSSLFMEGYAKEIKKLHRNIAELQSHSLMLKKRVVELEEEKKAGQFPRLDTYLNNGGWPKN